VSVVVAPPLLSVVKWRRKEVIIVTKKDIEKKLDEALDTFVYETKSLDDYSQRPVTEGELKEFAKQVFYVLDAVKDAIANYMD